MTPRNAILTPELHASEPDTLNQPTRPGTKAQPGKRAELQATDNSTRLS